MTGKKMSAPPKSQSKR
jgi:hypothetical protein